MSMKGRTKKCLSISFLIGLVSNFLSIVHAQNYSCTFDTDTVKSSLNVFGSYQLNSSALTNQFYKTVYTGGYVSDEIKNNIFNNLKKNNRIGADAGFGMVLAYTADSIGKRKLGKKLFIAFSQNYQFNSSFSGDLLKLILLGNHQFIGKNVNADGLSINYINYRKYSLGLRAIDTKNLIADISLSYYEGLSFLKFKANNFNIYTADNYADLDVNANYTLVRSDTTNSRSKFPKGRGAGLNAFTAVKIKRSTVYFSVENFGFISWDKNTLNCYKDTSFDYSGIQIDSLFQNTDTSSGSFNLNTFKKDFFTYSKNGKTLMLPFEVRLAIDLPISKKLTLTESLYWRYASDFKPFWLNQFNYQIGTNYKCGLGLAYGGWGKFSSSISFSCHPVKPFIISIYASGLEHFISPAETQSQGLLIKLQYILR